MKTQLPNELKKALIDRQVSFSAWCRYYQFPRETARNVAAWIIHGEWGISTEILRQLKEDFPAIYDAPAKRKPDLHHPKWGVMRRDSTGAGKKRAVRQVSPRDMLLERLTELYGSNRRMKEALLERVVTSRRTGKGTAMELATLEGGGYTNQAIRRALTIADSVARLQHPAYDKERG